MIDAKLLTKEDLIANLWLTDEILSELDIIDDEIKKKNISLKAIVEEAQSDYLKSVENYYYQSEEYELNEKFQILNKKIQGVHNIVVIADIAICTIAGYFFIYFGFPFWQVIIFWLVVPLLIFGMYYLAQKFFLNSRKPPISLRPLKEVLEAAQQNDSFQKIPDSLLATHIKQEIARLNQKKREGEEILSSQTVLTKNYQPRAKEIVWYLENKMADNLKEALIALEEADFRKQMKQMIEEQKDEIKSLTEKVDRIVKDYRKAQERSDLVAGKKKNSKKLVK